MSARLFFGAHVEAPWPQDYPKGRFIPEETRHLTFAFLGEQSPHNIQRLLDSAPQPPFLIGPAGIGNKLLFLPSKEHRVVALSVEWLDTFSAFNSYQNMFVHWLKENGYPLDERSFFPHITLARAPFDEEAWQKHFFPLPFFVKGLHLYRSKGNLEYQSLWEMPLLPPFEELEHTADLAFHIRGSTVQQLHAHAQLALAFKFPPLIHCFAQTTQSSLEEIIISLNEMISQADMEFGCPFKAVSFHGEIREDAQKLLHWNMIVDV